MLFVDKRPVGVAEAKALSGVEVQTARYNEELPDLLCANAWHTTPSFLYQATWWRSTRTTSRRRCCWSGSEQSGKESEAELGFIRVRRRMMPVTYTNRKGITYTLCQGVTKTGKPRYTFVRDPEGKRVVKEIPDGYKISESVNGIVSLIKERPPKLLSEEIETVKAAVHRHPKARNYRVNVKHDRIEVYESVGPDVDGLLSDLKEIGFLPRAKETDLRATLERSAQFTPVLRFILEDEGTRVYRAERWCYLGSIDDWIFITTGPVKQLARRMIPTLGTDEFFELF